MLFHNWDNDTALRPMGTTLRPMGTASRPMGTALRPMGTASRPMGTASRLMDTKTFAEGGFAIQAGTVEPGSQVLLEL